MPKFNITATFPAFVNGEGENASHILNAQVDAYNELAAARHFFRLGALPFGTNGYLNPCNAAHITVEKAVVKRAGEDDESEDDISIKV